MKFKVTCKKENEEALLKFLKEKGIEVADDGDFLITDNILAKTHILLKDNKGDKKHIDIKDIMYIEAFDHDVEVTAKLEKYYSQSPLYKVYEELDKKIFLRISNSVIINRKFVKEIIPSFSMKFTLLMQNGEKLTVTRSYYNEFKKFFRI